MAKPEPHYIDVDLKQKTQFYKPQITQHDTNAIVRVRLTDGGESDPAVVAAFDYITLTSRRKDREAFHVIGTVIEGTNEIEFELGTKELEQVGLVDASLQFYGPNDEGVIERISSAAFEYKVTEDIAVDRKETETEMSLIEVVLNRGPGVIADAIQATNDSIAERERLTSEVETSLDNLATEKGEFIEDLTTEKETFISDLTTEKTNFITEVTGRVDESLTDLETEKGQFLEDVTTRVDTSLDNLETEKGLFIEDLNEEVSTSLATLESEKTTAIGQLNTVTEKNKTTFQPAVATVAERATKYPTPLEGWTVRVTGESKTYRYTDGAWVVTDQYNPTAIDEMSAKLNDTERQTQLLQNGVNVLNADVATPVDFEIQGRTLVSLANSNLESLKYYALADKKSKIVVDGTTVAGIGKFQKKSTTLTVADFVGKVEGSTVANPHIAKRTRSNEPVGITLINPIGWVYEFSDYNLGLMTKLDGAASTGGSSNTTQVDGMAQHLFSFNIVEQVERQLGIIPKATLAEKVQWVKDNVSRLSVAWYGFGSSAGGNKATVVSWITSTNSWLYPVSHTGAVVSRISKNVAAPVTNYVDSNGFIHYLAYAEPSDGVTVSTISTDYINLEIELKPTAQLNTRGKIIRVENFEGKVSGSAVANPNIAYRVSSITNSPSQATAEFVDAQYALVNKLDGGDQTTSYTVAGVNAGHLFSFNLIEAVERNIGKIPAVDVAGKVEWLVRNMMQLNLIWYGFGSSPTGNKATIVMWARAWINPWNINSSSNLVTKLVFSSKDFSDKLDANGFVHFLAYAEPSDGVTASTINTDYVELEIELKPDADFRNPKVPLYEVTKEEYDKIGTTWTDDDTLKRFPTVEGVQHLVNPYVMAEGENLLPPFSEWNIGSNTIINGFYELEISSTDVGNKITTLKHPVVSGLTYTFSFSGSARALIYKESAVGAIVDSAMSSRAITFTADSSYNGFAFLRFDNALTAGTFSVKNPMLNIGSTPKPFTPRNPSYLFAETKLGAIGTEKDTLFRQDGQWKRRKVIEKDVILDGSNNWKMMGRVDLVHHNVMLDDNTFDTIKTSYYIGAKLIGHNGSIINKVTSIIDFNQENLFYMYNGSLKISIPSSLSGWGDRLSTPNEIKSYFNGWKYTDGITWASVTGNGQTANAQQALDTKPTDYTPYKLSYVLAKPVVENVTVEGDIVADGLTQVEVGSGFVQREKINFVKGGALYYSNTLTSTYKDSLYKYPTLQIIGLYKNLSNENLYRKIDILDDNPNTTNGKKRIVIHEANFDTSADYYVSYTIDRVKNTVNPTDVKAIFAKTIRSAVDDIANRFGDAMTRLSIVERAVVEIYVKLKALGAK